MKLSKTPVLILAIASFLIISIPISAAPEADVTKVKEIEKLA